MGGLLEIGECHAATIVFGFLFRSRAVTRAATRGESRR